MNVNLPQKSENSFFSKMKNFFKKLFYKENNSIGQNAEVKKDKEINQSNTILEMRKESQNLRLKDDILEIVEKNPDIIDSLSKENLERLDKLCDDEIIKLDKELEELKLKYQKLQAKLG